MRARDRQQSLPFPSRRGGRRRGAGRKGAPGRRPGVAHRRRPDHASRHPAHVTLRASVHCLRSPRLFAEARRAIGAASHAEFRVAHFSVQKDHLHLIVEAADRDALSRGVWGLAIRLTRAVNRVLERRMVRWVSRLESLCVRSDGRGRRTHVASASGLATTRPHRACRATCSPGNFRTRAQARGAQSPPVKGVEAGARRSCGRRSRPPYGSSVAVSRASRTRFPIRRAVRVGTALRRRRGAGAADNGQLARRIS